MDSPCQYEVMMTEGVTVGRSIKKIVKKKSPCKDNTFDKLSKTVNFAYQRFSRWIDTETNDVLIPRTIFQYSTWRIPTWWQLRKTNKVDEIARMTSIHPLWRRYRVMLPCLRSISYGVPRYSLRSMMCPDTKEVAGTPPLTPTSWTMAPDVFNLCVAPNRAAGVSSVLS